MCIISTVIKFLQHLCIVYTFLSPPPPPPFPLVKTLFLYFNLKMLTLAKVWIVIYLVVDVRYFPKGLFPSSNYPRVFIQAATIKGYLSKLQLSKGIYPSCNYPRVFIQAATNQGYLSKLQLSKGIYPSCNYPRVFIQAATIKGYLSKLQLHKFVLAAARSPSAACFSIVHA